MCQSAARKMPRPCCCAANSLCRAERDPQVSQGGSIVLIRSRALGNECGDRPCQLARICAERAPPRPRALWEVSGRARRKTGERAGENAYGGGKVRPPAHTPSRWPGGWAGGRVGSGDRTPERAAALPATGRRTTRRVASTPAQQQCRLGSP